MKKISNPELEQAAKDGLVEAQYLLALFYEQKDPPRIKEASKWLLKAASQGFAPAKNKIADILAMGKWAGVKKDIPKAISWYRGAAEKEFGPSQISLSTHYEFGIGVDIDLKDAFHWMKRAADGEWPHAYERLATMYKDGVGTKTNPKQAFYWYKKAAELGNASAAFTVANCYENGGFDRQIKFMKSDNKKALIWYRKATNMGNIYACMALHKIYSRGLLGQSIDCEKAQKYNFKQIIFLEK